MARGATVKVEGAKELRRTLKAAGADMSDFTAANRAAAALAAAAAAARAPRRTGRLAASVRAGASRTEGVIRSGGARVPYAGPIHWGWPARKIRANPFATMAASATEPQWVPIYEARLAAIISKVRGA